MNSTFCLKKVKIALYGVNHYALKHYLELEKEGYNVEAFIDKRAGKIEENDKKIFTCDAFIEKYKYDDNICIIIMLQNALQHDEIVKTFIKAGFNKFLFIPMHRNFIESYELEMRYRYNAFLNYQYSLLSNVSFFYNDSYIRKNKFESRIIKEEGNNLLLWVEKELIYSNSMKVVKGNSKREEYANIPLCAFKPYVEMMEYIMFGRENTNFRYLEDYGRNCCQYEMSLTDKDIIEQRGNLIEIFEREINFGVDFFVSSAPLAEWNKKGYFNLLEGQHRCLFLLLKGYNFIPIRIRKADFERWLYRTNFEEIESLKNYDMKYPILHPLFFENNVRQRCKRCVYLDDIFKFFDSLNMNNMTVFDASFSKGYFARNLIRRKVKCVYVYDKKKNGEVIDLINNIERIRDIEIVEDYFDSDILIIFDWLIYKKIIRKKLKRWRYIFLVCTKNNKAEVLAEFHDKEIICLDKIYYLNKVEEFVAIY